jgi:hypothetical protein
VSGISLLRITNLSGVSQLVRAAGLSVVSHANLGPLLVQQVGPFSPSGGGRDDETESAALQETFSRWWCRGWRWCGHTCDSHSFMRALPRPHLGFRGTSDEGEQLQMRRAPASMPSR